MKRNYKDHSSIRKYATITLKVLLGILAAVVFALLFGYGIMWLWNWLMPGVFGLTTIGYWQAVGILVLAKILFGGLGHHSGSSSHKSRGRCKKWNRNNLKSDMAKWKFYDKFWEEEGESAFKAFVERQGDNSHKAP